MLLTFWGGLLDRRGATIVGFLTSTLFITQAPAGVREPMLVALAALGGWALRYAANPRGLSFRAAVPPVLFLVVLGANYVMRPPETIAGQFAMFEQVCLAGTAAILFLVRRVSPTEASSEARTFHMTLVCVALVSGVDTAITIGANASAFSGSRQVLSIFGGSNYVAAILAFTIISCFYFALTTQTDRRLNIVAGGICLALFLPLESRTSIATLTAMALFTLATQRKSTRSWFVAVIGISILLLNYSRIPGLDRFSQADASLPDLNGRVDMWRFAAAQIQEYFWLGTGPGRLTDHLQSANYVPFYVHDIWLSLTAQYGVFIILLFVLGLWKLFGHATGVYVHVMALTVLIISTFEPAAETLKIGTVFVLIIVLGVTHARARDENWITR